MLADPSPAEREVLGAIPYVRNEAVLHTDVRLLPRRRRAWASWNCHLLDEAMGRTTITYHMNRLQSLRADRELLVTLNLADRIDPATVIGQYSFDHPVYTRAGLDAAAPLGGDQRRAPDPLLRRLLALGLSRGRRLERPARVPGARAPSPLRSRCSRWRRERLRPV